MTKKYEYDGTFHKFTGQKRDPETGLDYFGARYLSSSQGRFMSPDWSDTPTPVPYADFRDPQTLNLYSYVRNNPLNIADLDGHGLWAKLGNFLNYGEWTDDEEELERRLRELADQTRTTIAKLDIMDMSDLDKMSNKQVVDMLHTQVQASTEEFFNQYGGMLMGGGISSVSNSVYRSLGSTHNCPKQV